MSTRREPPSLRVLEPLDRRIPDWNMRRLIDRRCPFCAGKGMPRFLRPDGLRVNHCVRCGSYYISPAPDEKQLDEFYATYFSRHRMEELGRHLHDRLLVREMMDLNPADDEKTGILGTLIDLRGKKVLDAGFGLGQNLLLLRKMGCEVYGIDTDPDAVKFVHDVLQIHTVRHCALEDLPVQERYHLITLHDLVEHPLRPLDLLRRAVRHLEPGGFLSIWTPNVSSVADQESPVPFRVDLEHMQYLSVRTVAVLADMLPMHMIHLACTGTPRLEQIASLSGQPSFQARFRSAMRKLVRPFPGALAMTRVRRSLHPHRPSGTYHLFAVLRKPT